MLSSQQSPTATDNLNQKLVLQLEQREKENAAVNEEMRLLNLRLTRFFVCLFSYVKKFNCLFRLTSMNDVLTLQEAKLEQTNLSNSEKRQSLLNCWRTKVYDLLMQLKSMELILKNNSSKFSNGKTISIDLFIMKPSSVNANKTKQKCLPSI